jgi:murein L,D-transpeptidase YafK
MALRRSIELLSSLALAVCGAALLAGCEGPTESASGYRAYAPLSSETLELMRAKTTDQNAPMLIRAYKKEAELEVWKQKKDGKYVLFKTYPMCRWSGQLGPKKTEGDRQVPEGFYTITPGQMNPNSHYYLSFNVGYPNAYDRAHGYAGGNIMVHGICSSAGCFSMTDKQIEEIYALARESFAGGQHAIQMQSYPFHMTAENMAKLRQDPNMPFWKEIKKGSDYFDVTKLETPVGVCNKHYVFGATPKSGRFDALSPCPALNEDSEVASAVSAKEASDEHEVAELVSKGVKPVRIVYQDGGQNESFRTQRLADVSRPDALAAGAAEIALDEPKAKPAAVQIAASKANAKLAKARTETTKVAEATTVPATFQAAPSAYASEEPKSETGTFFTKMLKFGAAETPEAAPAIQAQPGAAPAQPVVAQGEPPVPAAKLPKPASKSVAAKTASGKGTSAVKPATPAPAPAAPQQAAAAAPQESGVMSKMMPTRLLAYFSSDKTAE